VQAALSVVPVAGATLPLSEGEPWQIPSGQHIARAMGATAAGHVTGGRVHHGQLAGQHH
jgi:hypothetical protein